MTPRISQSTRRNSCLLLDSRLALTGGITAERTTNDGNIDKFYFYPRYSGSYRVPHFVDFVDEIKVRAAYGQSGTQPNYGVKYTPFNTWPRRRRKRDLRPPCSSETRLIRPEAETEIETGFDATLFHSRAQFSPDTLSEANSGPTTPSLGGAVALP